MELLPGIIQVSLLIIISHILLIYLIKYYMKSFKKDASNLALSTAFLLPGIIISVYLSLFPQGGEYPKLFTGYWWASIFYSTTKLIIYQILNKETKYIDVKFNILKYIDRFLLLVFLFFWQTSDNNKIEVVKGICIAYLNGNIIFTLIYRLIKKSKLNEGNQFVYKKELELLP